MKRYSDLFRSPLPFTSLFLERFLSSSLIFCVSSVTSQSLSLRFPAFICVECILGLLVSLGAAAVLNFTFMARVQKNRNSKLYADSVTFWLIRYSVVRGKSSMYSKRVNFPSIGIHRQYRIHSFHCLKIPRKKRNVFLFNSLSFFQTRIEQWLSIKKRMRKAWGNQTNWRGFTQRTKFL